MQLANGFYLNRFQSTLSVRRATGLEAALSDTASISIHALRKESDRGNPGIAPGSSVISIHALRKESDRRHARAATRRTGISIHALRKESDLESRSTCLITCLFQSTLSVRRATGVAVEYYTVHKISIHALRKESDISGLIEMRHCLQFQSTLSVRRATRAGGSGMAAHDISIHALRKESDRAAGHFCPLSETQASCLALSISNNTTGTTNNMPKTSSCLSVSF